MDRHRLFLYLKQLAVVVAVLVSAVESDRSWAQTETETQDEAEETLSEAEIEQFVAPIALHPDAGVNRRVQLLNIGPR